MAIADKLMDLLTKQFKGASDTWTTVKTAAQDGTITSDILVKQGTKFWFDTYDRVVGFLPPTDETPVVFGQLPAAGPTYTSDPVSIKAVPAGTQLKTLLLPVHTKNNNATGTTDAKLEPDGTLKITVKAVANLTKDDLFLVPVYFTPGGGTQTTVALLVLSIT
jgi:hypothetical protein